MRLAITIPAILLMLTSGSGAAALTLQEAILYVLETNPEIEAAEADKQAIEFELKQARNQTCPRRAMLSPDTSSRLRSRSCCSTATAPGPR